MYLSSMVLSRSHTCCVEERFNQTARARRRGDGKRLGRHGVDLQRLGGRHGAADEVLKAGELLAWLHVSLPRVRQRLREEQRTARQGTGGPFWCMLYWSRIHERAVSLRFLGIILRFFRLEVCIYSLNIAEQFQTTFAQGRRGSKICKKRRKTLKTFVPIMPKNLASVYCGLLMCPQYSVLSSTFHPYLHIKKIGV